MNTLVVNGEEITFVAFEAMDKATIRTVDVSGCTGLTTLDAPAAEWVAVSVCTGLTTLDAPAAEWVYVRGCTGLTTLDAPAAELVDVRGCTGLTTLDAPAAKTVYVSGCTGLTTLDAPAAKTVYVSWCTGAPAVVSAGCDARGYEFHAVRVCDAWRVSAGCRYFTLAKARAHWREGSNCRALVERLVYLIAERNGEWA